MYFFLPDFWGAYFLNSYFCCNFKRNIIMKKLFFLLVFSFAYFNMIKADVNAVDDPIILTEKFDNPIDGHGDPGKSSTFLYMYQSGNVFSFDQSYEDCAVSLLLNNVTIFTSIVDENGQVIVPSSLTGVFELQITVDDVVYWAEVIL